MKRFIKMHYHVEVTDKPENEPTPMRLEKVVRTAFLKAEEEPSVQTWNDEMAARYYVESFLLNRKEKGVRALTAPERPELMPDLRLESSAKSPLTGTQVVQFSQTSRAVPIFGTKAVVEMDGTDRRLVSFDASLAEVPNVSPVAAISPEQALNSIAETCQVPLKDLTGVAAPELNYFLDEEKSWHLVHYFKDIPAMPPEQREGQRPFPGLGRSPRDDYARYDFLVDAHTGLIVYYFSSHATLDIPVPCQGRDEYQTDRQFWGRQTGPGFDLCDPLRRIETYDLKFGDITAPTLPKETISHTAADFGVVSTAGISAHYHATLVVDFFNNILKRKGVDDKGMTVVSLINCTYSQDESPPNWRNAVWWNSKMWYGQVKNNAGGFDSFARFLDVIAHELTHGVTETTSNLVYRDQSGALNESFSDIFGIIIKNWYPGQPNTLATWDWEIGSGLGPGGLPLRDMRDPTRTGDPDHMSSYLSTTSDNGGVHTNSNIHNKAAYNLFTATDAQGNPEFTPTEVGILYYLTLTRLSRLATFSDCLRTLISVANTYFSGNPAVQAQKRAAIEGAYRKVGIT